MPLTDPVAVFTVVVLVLLAAPLAARRGVQSSVVLLAAGIALGPHAFGVLDRDATMVLLGTIGLLYIMFLAGLEIDLHELAEGRVRSLGFGAATFLIPQLVGTGMARVGLGMDWAAAILLGSVFASHTLLAYPAASRLGLQKERSVTAAVGATILTDTLALLVLAVVATGTRAGGTFDVWVPLRVSGALLAFGALVLWGLPRLGSWFMRTAASDATLEFIFVLAAVFVCALGVEAMGIEPIIGAFLAGLGLNRLVPEESPLMNRVSFVGNALFIPFFLLATGMLVDLSAFTGGPDSGRAWTVALAMTGTLLITKGLAAWLTRPAFRFTSTEAAVVFGLTVPQAAATLAAVLIGVQVGLFDGAVLNGSILMVFITCLVGPFVVERAGRRLAALADRRMPEVREGRRVLVSVSNPATVGPLVDLAMLVREARSRDPLTAVTVVPKGSESSEAVVRAERLLSAAVVHAAGAEVAVLPLIRVETNVARALARTVAGTRSSLVVTGWDGSAAAERLLFGSIPDRVRRETDATVLVAREVQPAATLKRLLVAVPPLATLEPGFGAAARIVATLAGRLGARVVLVSPGDEPDALLAAYALAVPSGPPPERRILGAWDELVETLSAHARPDDGLVLVSAREGTVAWQSSLDRLPRVLAHRFPEQSLFVLYPGDAPTAAILPRASRDTDPVVFGQLTPDVVRIGLVPGAPLDVVMQVLGEHLTESEADALASSFAGEGAGALTEICPGVVLAHVRTESDRRMVGVGVHPDGLPLSGVSTPVHLVLALVVPESVPSRTYLGWLARLARMVREEETIERLRQAVHPAQVVEVLQAALDEEIGTGGGSLSGR